MNDPNSTFTHFKTCEQGFLNALEAFDNAEAHVKQKMPEGALQECLDQLRIWANDIGADCQDGSRLEKLSNNLHFKDTNDYLKRVESSQKEIIDICCGNRLSGEDMSDSEPDLFSIDVDELAGEERTELRDFILTEFPEFLHEIEGNAIKEGDKTEEDEKTEMRNLVRLAKAKVDEANEGRTELRCHVESIKFVLTFLMELDARMLCSEPLHLYRYLTDNPVNHSEQFDVQHVRGKFPQADEFLILRLGKAITGRRHYLQYAGQFGKVGRDDLRTLPDGHLQLQEDDEEAVSQTACASTTNDESTIRPPTIPVSGQNAERFKCPLCFWIIRVRSTLGWRKHVYHDLRPYLCTFEDCITPNRAYMTLGAWWDHEVQEHRRYWLCFPPCFRRVETEEDFRNHIANEHPDLVSDNEFFNLSIHYSQRTGMHDQEVECLLCREKVPALQLQSHLGHHQEELSLFSLYPQAGGDDDHEENKQTTSTGSAVGQESVDADACGEPSSAADEKNPPNLTRTLSEGNSEAVGQAVKDAPDDDVLLDENEDTRLHLAVRRNDLETAKLLLAQGDHPDYCGPRLKVTPLILAAHVGYPEMVELLLQHGADPELMDCLGNYAIDVINPESEHVFKIQELLQRATDRLSDFDSHLCHLPSFDPAHIPYGYHPDHNSTGYRPKRNRFADHLKHNPTACHPEINPAGDCSAAEKDLVAKGVGLDLDPEDHFPYDDFPCMKFRA